MKAYRVVVVWIHIFLASALAGGEWSASHPCRFIPVERDPGTHWIGSYLGDIRSGQREEKILDPTGTQTPTPRSFSP
jgi:hypothetical protein